MKEKTEELIEWLRDAYAMEKSMEQMLQRVTDDDSTLTAIRRIARTHRDETIRHAEDVERCLQILGADTSSLKTGTAAIGEFFKDALTSFASDKKIKDILSGYAAEHFEIACYTAIRTTAQSIGETRITQICDAILEDEYRMAEELKERIPDAINLYLMEA